MQEYEISDTSDEIRDEVVFLGDFASVGWALFLIGIALLLILWTI